MTTRTLRRLVAGGLSALVLLAGGAAFAAPAWTPPPDTITKVQGDAANGFTVFFYDGSTISPPTDSEARAECSEYDVRIDRVRCRTEVRVWYTALGELKRALRYARLRD